ncbi:MAG: 4-hydroxy-tetrahydrodipicolinate synthase [Clostridiales bacterium]|nr:4-hydroxy-tetrahydrodipicolinate synthase [Clostridiales bacterium]
MGKQTLFSGSAAALITPFTPDEQVDEPALRELIERQIAAGTDALVVCGTTGEPATMTEKEQDLVIDLTVRQTRRRIPVLAGTGGNCTRAVIRRARRARELGADGQLCVTPYYNKATQKGLIAHYTAIHDQTDLPIILYNVPTRTGLNMLPETAAALAPLPRIVGIKDASGSLEQAEKIVQLCGDRLPLYAGVDELSVALRGLGAAGAIFVLANIAPALCRSLMHAPMAEAHRLRAESEELMRALSLEVNPIPVKAAAARLGLCQNVLRLPLTPLEEGHVPQLEQAMASAGLIC